MNVVSFQDIRTVEPSKMNRQLQTDDDDDDYDLETAGATRY